MKRYPFKFLDAYAKEDHAIYFGRESEVDELYGMVFQTNLLMVYGASGTGKTSLIRCGLANRFKASQWLDLYIRRGEDINQSLLNLVNQKLAEQPPYISEKTATSEEGDWFEEFIDETRSSERPPDSIPLFESDKPIVFALRQLYMSFFTPVYLIFDQFEELYTLGNPKEQEEFIETIRELVQAPMPLKILLVMREEYLANIFELEQAVPQLRNKKLRIEPMDLPKVEEVILNATVKNPDSNIELENGKEVEVANAILEHIREGDVNVKLPYLQVYMDSLYQKITGEESKREEIVKILLEDVEAMGEIGNVLANFIDQQNQKICKTLTQKFRDLPTDIVWQLLSPFASLEGTKIPIKKGELSEVFLQLELPKVANKEKFLNVAISELEKSRILRLRREDHTYEVAHDTLAVQIAEKRDEEEKAYLKSKHLVKDNVRRFEDVKTYLSQEQLAYIRPYELKLGKELEPQEFAYIKRSKSKRRRQQGFLWSGVITAFGTAIYVIIVVSSAQQETQRLATQLEDERNKTQAALIQAYKDAVTVLQFEYQDAIDLLDRGRQIPDFPQDILIQRLQDSTKLNQEIDSLGYVIDSLENNINQDIVIHSHEY